MNTSSVEKTLSHNYSQKGIWPLLWPASGRYSQFKWEARREGGRKGEEGGEAIQNFYFLSIAINTIEEGKLYPHQQRNKRVQVHVTEGHKEIGPLEWALAPKLISINFLLYSHFQARNLFLLILSLLVQPVEIN